MRQSVSFGVFGMLLVGFAVQSASAATCPGDCSGTLTVRINDLITCVSIALQTQPVNVCSACDVNGDGMVRVDELIDAVNSVLFGCPGAPTPTPGGSSPTPAESPATPTVTPTAGASVSMWTIGDYHIVSSHCATMISDFVLSGLRALGSDVTVRESDGNAEIDFGAGQVFDGTADPDGTVHVQTTAHGNVGTCDYEIDDTTTVNPSTSPTTATYDDSVKLSGSCRGLSNCSLEITSPWTQQ